MEIGLSEIDAKSDFLLNILYVDPLSTIIAVDETSGTAFSAITPLFDFTRDMSISGPVRSRIIASFVNLLVTVLVTVPCPILFSTFLSHQDFFFAVFFA